MRRIFGFSLFDCWWSKSTFSVELGICVVNCDADSILGAGDRKRARREKTYRLLEAAIVTAYGKPRSHVVESKQVRPQGDSMQPV